MNETANQACPVCGRDHRGLIDAATVPPGVIEIARAAHPDWNGDVLCADCVNDAKAMEMTQILDDDADGVVTDLEAEVIESIRSDTLLAPMTEEVIDDIRSGEGILADRITLGIASWWFPAGILTFLIIWVGFNAAGRPFEPYPVIIFAVISAVLASLAALQGPVIIRSQRWARRRAQEVAENDYRINLKAELEIRYLDEKLDLVLANQARLEKAVEELREAGDNATLT